MNSQYSESPKPEPLEAGTAQREKRFRNRAIWPYFLAGAWLVLILFSLAGLYAYFREKSPYPAIQGTLLADPLTLKPFHLLDHKGRIFSNNNLNGRWHLVTYGYTSCPDICPTTLAVLAEFLDHMNVMYPKDDVRVLFYSIDPQTDSVERLNLYVPYFHPNFLGLRQANNESQPDSMDSFASSLGMVSVITPAPPNVKGAPYAVAHGIMLFLLNPQGKLQAVLKPSTDREGRSYFTAQQVERDYSAVRQYAAQSNTLRQKL